MGSRKKPLNLRQIEVVAVLSSLGGRSTYERWYRAVRESLLSNGLKLSGRATFNKEVKNLIKLGIVKRVKTGKRYEYYLAEKIPISSEWLLRHAKRLKYVKDRIEWSINQGYLHPSITRLFFWNKLIIEAMIDEIFRHACRGEEVEPAIRELATLTQKIASELRRLSPDAKAEYHRIAGADILRIFYQLESIAKSTMTERS